MKKIVYYIVSVAACFFFCDCTGIDETYKEFLEDSDVLYPGKVDSVKVATGKERIKFNMLLSSDPKVKKVRIYWNDKLDYIDTEVIPEEIGTRKDILIPKINEGEHTFFIYTYDAHEQVSVPTEVVTKVYGERFQQKLSNRSIQSSARYIGNDVEITWDAVNVSYADVTTEVTYEKNDGSKVTVNVASNESKTILSDYNPENPFTYKTYILPDSSCMDRFVVEEQVQHVISYYDDLKIANWSIKAFSSDRPQNPVQCCIDGNDVEAESTWINDTASGTEFPHWVIIDMGKEIDVDAFYFIARQQYEEQVRDLELFTNSTGDDTQEWKSLGKYSLPRLPGRLTCNLEKSQKVRYVKYYMTSNWKDGKNCGVVELGAMKYW